MTRRKGSLVLAASGVLCALGANGQPRAIDTAKSVMTVRVYKAGVFSAFAHDHEIAAPIAGGAADVAGRHVELNLEAGALRVRDPKASEKERGEIQATMLGPEVLDAGKYPQIAFRSTAAEASGQSSWRVTGDLTLHGKTRPVALEVKEGAAHYVGQSMLKLTDFGIKPIRIAGGAIKVKDEIRIEFDIQIVP